jgi:hypothetical protein
MVVIKSINIVSSLDLDKTPIVRFFMKEARSNGLKVTINRMNIKPDVTIFVGNGIMHRLLFSSYFGRNNIVYWSLESYTGFENNSKIMWLTRLQYLVNWRRIILMLPLKERRLEFPIKTKKIIIFKNVPFSCGIKESDWKGKTIDFVHYGELDNSRVYTEEILKLCSSLSKDVLCIGRNAPAGLIMNVKKSTSHNELLEILRSSKFGFVGYRPIDFNTRFCAPNKMFEMMSMGVIPLISAENIHLGAFIVDNRQIVDWTLEISQLKDQIHDLNQDYLRVSRECLCLVQSKYNIKTEFGVWFTSMQVT